MRAAILEAPRAPLRVTDRPDPEPGEGQVLLRVLACGVCRTDLHLVDGEVPVSSFPRVLGHQIVGERVDTGERVGVPWLGWADGTCAYCRSGRENLCDAAKFTGADLDGGFAEYTVAFEDFCLPLPDAMEPTALAPLLCAGLIGHRALRMTGDAERLGIYGFGSAAHIVTQVARHQGRRVFAFTRAGDETGQAFARDLGAEWAGSVDDEVPEALDAALIFAPAGELVPAALAAVVKGGIVVCGGIHMSDIPSFSYDLLWGERTLKSVANLTRDDGRDFLRLAPEVPVRTTVTTYSLEDADRALDDLREGRFRGAAVVVPGGEAAGLSSASTPGAGV